MKDLLKLCVMWKIVMLLMLAYIGIWVWLEIDRHDIDTQYHQEQILLEKQQIEVMQDVKLYLGDLRDNGIDVYISD